MPKDNKKGLSHSQSFDEYSSYFSSPHKPKTLAKRALKAPDRGSLRKPKGS